jgi:nucleoside 2-deoxyribosyltransferase
VPPRLIYIAGPLFNEGERAFNSRLDEFLIGLGYRTFLPQREAGEAMKLIDAGEPAEVVRPRLFDLDWRNVQGCDLLLMLVDGRVPDEGACVELGMAFALGKPCVGFQTDSRRFARGYNNVMLDGCLRGIAHEWDELPDLISKALES